MQEFQLLRKRLQLSANHASLLLERLEDLNETSHYKIEKVADILTLSRMERLKFTYRHLSDGNNITRWYLLCLMLMMVN